MPADAARAKSLFLVAADFADPAERAAFLNHECGSDTELLARVEALLRANDAAPLPAQPATQSYSSHDEQPGFMIAGKYTLVEPIGEGGMGTVWRAKQSEPVKRFVAIKLIKAGMDSKQVLARFEAERQALALMDHPNIAKVLDGGLHERRPFFVMELVKGVPITKYCDAHKLTPKQRLELFVPVCQSIQHAHQKGIIHRDIKPSNVLVALYDDNPVVKVIDFGVAKATGGTLTEATIDTGFGSVLGTPEYMSPEQATFNNLDIDTRTDVYALGALLYELLTGSPPFSRKELEHRGLLEMLRIVREDEPSRPSTKLSTADALPTLSAVRGTEPKKLTGLLRNELDWIVMKALEKDRNRRYETARALGRDLERFLSDETIEARPPTWGYRMKKFYRRNRHTVRAGLLVLIFLIVGIVGTTTGMFWALQALELAANERNRAQEAHNMARLERDRAQDAAKAAWESQQSAEAERDRASLAEKEAKKQAEITQAVSDFLRNDLLGQANPFAQSYSAPYADPNVTMREILMRASKKVSERFRQEPRIAATLHLTMGQAYMGLSLYPEAKQQLEKAIETYRQLLINSHLGSESFPDINSLIQARLSLLQVQVALGERVSLELFQDIENDLNHLELPPEWKVARETFQRLAAKASENKQKPAELLEQIQQKAREIAATTGKPLDAKLAEEIEAVFRPAKLLAKGDHRGAELFLREELKQTLEAQGVNSLKAIPLMQGITRLQRMQGKNAEAIGTLNDCLLQFAPILGANHLASAELHQELGYCHFKDRNLAKAEKHLREALNYYSANLPGNHANSEIKVMLAAILNEYQGKAAEVESLLLEAFRHYQDKNAALTKKELQYLGQVAKRLQQFYQSLGKSIEADKWQDEVRRLTKIQSPTP